MALLLVVLVYVGVVLTSAGQAISVIVSVNAASREKLLNDVSKVVRANSLTPYRIKDMAGRTVDMINGGSLSYYLFVGSVPPDADDIAQCVKLPAGCQKVEYAVMVEPQFLLRPLWPRKWTVRLATNIKNNLAARGYAVSLRER